MPFGPAQRAGWVHARLAIRNRCKELAVSLKHTASERAKLSSHRYWRAVGLPPPEDTNRVNLTSAIPRSATPGVRSGVRSGSQFPLYLASTVPVVFSPAITAATANSA